MTPTELESARRLVDEYGALQAAQRSLSALRVLKRGNAAELLPKLLAHADALAAENELLQALVNDAAAEGPSAALLIQAAAQEREACCKATCFRCQLGRPAEQRFGRGWLHPDAPGSPDGYGCEAAAIRERGPCRPPLPSGGLREGNERLRELLGLLANAAMRVLVGPSPDGTAPAPAAAWRGLDKATCAAKEFLMFEARAGE